MRTFMVFDVESIGLHGEGFAVGWVVIDEYGEELEASHIGCPADAASGSAVNRTWVNKNVPQIRTAYSPLEVRELFWNAWLEWKHKGALLAAECAWPVEASFLSHCVAEDPTAREWQGPYPLIDIASVRLAAGFDPLAKCDRFADELPEHNPLADARQSARLLIEALDKISPR